MRNTQILELIRVKYIILDKTVETRHFKGVAFPTADISRLNFHREDPRSKTSQKS